ncbi:68d7ae61-4734-44a0-8c99-fc7922374a7f [Thermothielavioides terrestris]|uniref:tRNA-splicing endonuclease subunit Sen2 n=1 Tax=Thermothielavioides terrestris TaxID=2587410 RepID=A0A446BG33_9PEZI|nr:68d7ae61-4734-44a0-8c99-fc7922374a7f [Thermothielavioides terrestris]
MAEPATVAASSAGRDAAPDSAPIAAVASALSGRASPPRPSLNQIYALPAPIRTFPLPAFYPNNPISLLHLTYAWLSQVFRPPPREPSVIHVGVWDPETRSVHVRDPTSIRALWEQGFYGKGSLSRSEPNWLKRELARRGSPEGKTVSEARTEQRREERRLAKWERAKAELEAIEKQRLAEAASHAAAAELSKSVPLGESFIKKRDGRVAERRSDLEASDLARSPPAAQPVSESPPELGLDAPVSATEIENKEHFQLAPEEAFFLVFSLGALRVVDPVTSSPISTEHLLSLFRAYSHFPPRPHGSRLGPDDPFLVNYAVYHHFRSLGWVPRHGIKFGVDWILYQRGPVFDHSEFGIMVMPTFSDPAWEGHEHDAPRRSWSWLMGVNRVLSHVLKSLVLVYVDIPSPPVFDEQMRRGGIAAALKKYTIREIMVRRFSVNRNR